MLFLLSACSNKPADNEQVQPQAQVESISNSYVTSRVLEAGGILESQWFSFHKPFRVVWSNEREELKKFDYFSMYPNEQQTEFYIMPSDLREQINFKSVIVEGKNITVTYTVGKSKIPRVVGHVQEFDATGFAVNTEFLDSGVYHLRIVDENSNKTTMTQELNFTKPYYALSWKTKNIQVINDKQIVFSSTMETGEWSLWSYDLTNKNAEPKRMTSRHNDMPLNQLPTLGNEDINTPIPIYNTKLDRIIYHSNHDLWSITRDGPKIYSLTIQHSEYPI